MSKIRQTTLILGEGVTEFFFLQSLKDDYSALKTVKPDYPKNTSLDDLENEIEKAVRDFNKVFCLIDMDNKKEGKEQKKYAAKKSKAYKDEAGSDCSFSELGELFDELINLQKNGG